MASIIYSTTSDVAQPIATTLPSGCRGTDRKCHTTSALIPSLSPIYAIEAPSSIWVESDIVSSTSSSFFSSSPSFNVFHLPTPIIIVSPISFNTPVPLTIVLNSDNSSFMSSSSNLAQPSASQSLGASTENPRSNARIVGPVISGVGGLLAIVLLLVFVRTVRRRKRRNLSADTEESPTKDVFAQLPSWDRSATMLTHEHNAFNMHDGSQGRLDSELEYGKIPGDGDEASLDKTGGADKGSDGVLERSRTISSGRATRGSLSGVADPSSDWIPPVPPVPATPTAPPPAPEPVSFAYLVPAEPPPTYGSWFRSLSVSRSRSRGRPRRQRDGGVLLAGGSLEPLPPVTWEQRGRGGRRSDGVRVDAVMYGYRGEEDSREMGTVSPTLSSGR